MKNWRTPFNKSLRMLNKAWQQLSFQQQKFYILCFFCAYAIISMLVLTNSCLGSKHLDPLLHQRAIMNPLESINPKNFDSLLIPRSKPLKQENHGN